MRPHDGVIVLVEDNDDDADLTIRALRRVHDASIVVRINDGVEALAYLGNTRVANKRRPADVVLLDLKLPRIDGFGVLRQLRADENPVPVVVLTSSLEERDLAEAYQLGANSYIRKPAEFAQLVAAVDQIYSYWLQLNEPPES